ncbi:MAG: SDR family NAD(P)-dependent oxidoreductase [Gammaproteobacteria bacterium]
MARLTGKTAIITGAAGGIGVAAVKRFVAEGARVLAVDIDESALSNALDGVQDDRASAMVADVTKAHDMAACVDAAVSRYDKLDIALLNAGIEGQVTPITEYPEDMFDRVLAINVRGVWLGLKYAMRAMTLAGGGSIVITSSIAGVRGRQGICAYVASKHAVVGLMRTAALEGAGANIRVNTVNPAPVDTRMIRSLEVGFDPDDPDSVRRRYVDASPMKRYATPDEAANLMLFLASDESSHCTGSTYMLDGGRTAG